MSGAIAIVGGGWLGQPLALSIQQQGVHPVYVTRTSEQGVKELQHAGLNGLLLKLPFTNQDQTSQFVQSLIEKNVSTIIGSFPPGFRKGQGQQYLLQWQALIEVAKQANIDNVIMVSSTTVYPQVSGTVKEEDATLQLAANNALFSDNARTMLAAEQALIESTLGYMIVRCSGLFGPNRHPGRFVSKLKSISSAAPANMLHLHDAIGVIQFVLSRVTHQIINASSPALVYKSEFYQTALQQYDATLNMPEITTTADKQISSQKLQQSGYHFVYSNAIDGLQHC
ncbi:nucleoside-diphosphate sugar epimerase [Vibrio sp. MACH09]|uniref:NAD-dependent epimerase/dehydratase family protein n=1 Tax=Vibrio sp. MACH09 TaxID=3025122 RepID=UPI00278F3546|nr:NAD(P)H-binding protein [Vibrio sp. MACH09]GLO61200.1 nucleoside-diphosphate sugar epimerase [Vibrio sp. MACH09]